MSDLRQQVLDGIDREISLFMDPPDEIDEKFLTALRLLRVDTERHIRWDNTKTDESWCEWCEVKWPCSPIRERAEVYAKEEASDKHVEDLRDYEDSARGGQP